MEKDLDEEIDRVLRGGKLLEEIEKTFLERFGKSVLDYPGADADINALSFALIRGGEWLLKQRKGKGFGLEVDPMAAEFIAVSAAESIALERLTTKRLMYMLEKVLAELKQYKEADKEAN